MLLGVYIGVVEKVGDAEKLGRLKVRVPAVYGVLGSGAGAVRVDDLPWALPMGLPAGGSNESGGFSMLPAVGDQVAVQFLDGEPEKPVWTSLMQTQAQAKTLQLHQYEADSQGAAANPARAILTRFGDSLELRRDSVVLTSAEGQQVLLQTSKSAAGGSAALQTPKGQYVKLDDLAEGTVIQALQSITMSGSKVMLNAPTSILGKTGRFTITTEQGTISIQDGTVSITTLSGASLIIDPDGNIAINSAGNASLSLENDLVQLGEPTGTGLVIEQGKLSVNADECVLNTAALSVGTVQGYPVLMLTPQTLAWILGHTHTNGNNGSPTGPPIPLDVEFPVDSGSKRMQTT